MEEKKKILLHCCCGPCSTTCVKRLINEGWEPVIWYGNDNIYPESEFNTRGDNLAIVAKQHHLTMIRKEYQHQEWRKAVKGLEEEKEGGKRCSACFTYNLKIAEQKARELHIPYFTTTLTVSRYKNSPLIFSIGEKDEGFMPFNFKKKGGYEESIRLSKELNLYRQQYCGCEFSKAESDKYRAKKALEKN